ncbi:hypothetical protein [Salibacterium sp. K-3]
MINVIVMVLLLIAVLSFFSKRRFVSEKWVTGRKIFWVFGGYVLVLLLSTAHYSLFLTGSASSEQTLSPSHVQEEAEKLRQQAASGSLDAIEDDYLRNEWTLEPVDEVLLLKADTSELPVYYVKGSYEQPSAAYYQSPSVINGEQAVTEYQPTIEQNVNILSVYTDPKVTEERNYAGYKKEFPMLPFDSSVDQGDPYNLNLGYGVLIVNVPEQLDVEGEGFVQQAGTEE